MEVGVNVLLSQKASEGLKGTQIHTHSVRPVRGIHARVSVTVCAHMCVCVSVCACCQEKMMRYFETGETDGWGPCLVLGYLGLIFKLCDNSTKL